MHSPPLLQLSPVNLHCKLTTQIMSKRAECHVLIFFLLALIQGKEDSFYPGWCHMSPATQQHPVQGVLEVYQTGKGCNSHGTAALPHEVHIINLKETAMHQNLPEVTLHLKPVSSSQSIQHKLAVFILNSQNPVVWKLNVEQPSSSMQHIFHISEESRLCQLSESNTEIIIREHALPKDTEQLLSWAETMFGAVTTLVQYSLVNNVYLTLGEDSLAPSTCTLQENFLSEKYLASELKPYSLQGCINHNQQLIPDVHVICLQEGTFNPYSVLQTQIIIEIQSQQTNHTIQCHLILILQNKKPISCVVRSHNAHGQLTVHASDSITITVNTEPSLIVKKMSLPNLSTSKDLHSWTQQHRLPSVTSYTEAKLANRLRIIIRDNGGTEPKAPSYSCSTDKDIQPANDPKEAWSQLTLESGKEATLKQNGINQTLEIVKERLTFMKKVVRMMGRNHTAITVTCLPQKMVVEISKDTLQMLGTLPSKITLRDQSCTATSNSTHFLLETPLNSCGTVTATDPLGEGFDILYQNSVLLWQQTPIAQAKQDDFNETLSTQQKAEDGPRILNFSCVYPTFEPPTASLEDKPNEEEVEAVNFPVFLSNALFRLDLYNSELFTQRQHGAYKVVVNSHVFVEVTMTLRSAKLSFTILKCYHSPASDPEQHTGHALIEKACPLDESVTFYATHHRGLPINPTSQEHQRFSFLLRPLYNDSIQFLHCKLTMCHKGIQRNKNSPSIPECVPLDEVCTGSSSNQELAVGIFSRTVSKPMIVLIDTELGFSDNHKAPPEAEGGSTDASSDTSVMSRFGLLQPHADQGIPLPGVTGIAFAAFLIGIILTGAMWFIYYQTDAAKMVRHVPVQSVGSESREMAVSSSPLTPMEYATTMI